MNTNLEYIRTFLGERGSSNPLLSDAELSAMMSLAIRREVPQRLAIRMLLQGAEWAQLSSDGLLRLKLHLLSNAPAEYHAGIGNWLDGAYHIRIGDVSYQPAEGDTVDTYGGRIVFAQAPLAGSIVTVDTCLIDLRAVLVSVLELMRAAQARISLRASLSGMGVDLTSVCARLQAEIDALSTGYALPFTPSEDFPH
jgi:hypothetical protein